MSTLLSEMTREQIRQVAPGAVAVLPLAAIEQHGPHLPVCTDLLICETVAQRAVEATVGRSSAVVTPALCFGNSHHHYPFPGVLSLTSHTYIAAVTEVLESLVRSGFRKLVLFNGHGGNTDANGVVALDMVNRLGHPVSVATASYWDISREALTEGGMVADALLPGHAGYFETSMVMAIRPDLVDRDALVQLGDTFEPPGRIFEHLSGATVQTHGVWAAGPGVSDNPVTAGAEIGRACLEIMVEQVADFLMAFAQRE